MLCGKVTQLVFHGWHRGYILPLHLQVRQCFGVLFVCVFFLLLTLLQSYLRDSVCYSTWSNNQIWFKGKMHNKDRKRSACWITLKTFVRVKEDSICRYQPTSDLILQREGEKRSLSILALAFWINSPSGKAMCSKRKPAQWQQQKPWRQRGGLEAGPGLLPAATEPPHIPPPPSWRHTACFLLADSKIPTLEWLPSPKVLHPRDRVPLALGRRRAVCLDPPLPKQALSSHRHLGA